MTYNEIETLRPASLSKSNQRSRHSLNLDPFGQAGGLVRSLGGRSEVLARRVHEEIMLYF
jgi:hypothetical protein